jgi:aspartate kinase
MSVVPVRVLKFGGTAMASIASIRHSAEIALQTERERGSRIAVVVSAMAGETDRLLNLGHAPLANLNVPGANPVVAQARAELDTLASAGEQAASALFALNLRALGRAARSFVAHQLPIRTDSRFGDAEIQWIATAELEACFARGEIPVVAGFQGVDALGRLTTLGRGGSDTTAVALAVALGAEECVFFKDVDGVFTADPKKVATATRFDALGFDEMLELSRTGAKVLHDKCVALARCYGMPLAVKGLDGNGAETRVGTMEVAWARA